MGPRDEKHPRRGQKRGPRRRHNAELHFPVVTWTNQQKQSHNGKNQHRRRFLWTTGKAPPVGPNENRLSISHRNGMISRSDVIVTRFAWPQMKIDGLRSVMTMSEGEHEKSRSTTRGNWQFPSRKATGYSARRWIVPCTEFVICAVCPGNREKESDVRHPVSAARPTTHRAIASFMAGF